MSDPAGERLEQSAQTEFIGTFVPAERAYLARQFGACRFTLVARSTGDDRVILCLWQPARSGGPARGPRPLFTPPTQAVYVLDRSGDPLRPRCTRVDTQAEIDTRFAGHFAGVQAPFPARARFSEWWRRIVPRRP